MVMNPNMHVFLFICIVHVSNILNTLLKLLF